MIGSKMRVKYIEELDFYREENQSIPDAIIVGEFRKYFLFNRSRMFAILFATAIPWYLLSPLRGAYYTTKDYIILSVFALLTLIATFYYFWGVKRYKKFN